MQGAFFGFYESPIGLIEVVGTSGTITSLRFVEQRRPGFATNATVDEALRQVSGYFLGTRRVFDIPITLRGTDFQQLVWEQLLRIPFGRTVPYQEIANAIGKPQAVRAVGAANGKNPISIIVPCHRVIGSNESLTGYGGGLWRKEWLLRHERCQLL